jgi:hypothetical protein
MLPTKDKSPVLKRTIRSTRSKPSVTPNALVAPVHAPAPVGAMGLDFILNPPAAAALVAPVHAPAPVDAPAPVNAPEPISAQRRLLFLSPAEREAEIARMVKEQQEREAREQQEREAKERQEVQEAPFLGPASKQWKLSHPKWKL